MAAEIYERDIQVGTEMAWHRLTQVVPEITTDNCGILYPMEKQPLFLPSGIKTPHYVTVSLDDGLPIGPTVSEKYALISNGDVWCAVQEALEGAHHKITSVGTVCDREKGFISVELNEDFLAAGRQTQSRLNILWGHGGVSTVIAKSGFTMVVCGNTYNMALKESGDFSFKIRHTGLAHLKIDDMKIAIETHFGVQEEFMLALNEFQEQSVSSGDALKFFAGFVVGKEKEKDTEVSTIAFNQYMELHKLFHRGAGNEGKNVADVFAATTDFYTHGFADSEVSMQKRFVSSEFGTGQKRKEEVFKLLTDRKVPRVGDYDECVRRGEKVLQLAG
ncbi:MAG: DUF932 domain-containing protein [Candidatus Paceibacterota bacterium]|jgi:hypothetical protein